MASNELFNRDAKLKIKKQIKFVNKRMSPFIEAKNFLLLGMLHYFMKNDRFGYLIEDYKHYYLMKKMTIILILLDINIYVIFLIIKFYFLKFINFIEHVII